MTPLSDFDEAAKQIIALEYTQTIFKLLLAEARKFNLDESATFSLLGLILDRQLALYLNINLEFCPESFSVAAKNFSNVIKRIENDFKPN